MYVCVYIYIYSSLQLKLSRYIVGLFIASVVFEKLTASCAEKNNYLL
jgi:hypothetical protein